MWAEDCVAISHKRPATIRSFKFASARGLQYAPRHDAWQNGLDLCRRKLRDCGSSSAARTSDEPCAVYDASSVSSSSGARLRAVRKQDANSIRIRSCPARFQHFGCAILHGLTDAGRLKWRCCGLLFNCNAFVQVPSVGGSLAYGFARPSMVRGTHAVGAGDFLGSPGSTGCGPQMAARRGIGARDRGRSYTLALTRWEPTCGADFFGVPGAFDRDRRDAATT